MVANPKLRARNNGSGHIHEASVMSRPFCSLVPNPWSLSFCSPVQNQRPAPPPVSNPLATKAEGFTFSAVRSSLVPSVPCNAGVPARTSSFPVPCLPVSSRSCSLGPGFFVPSFPWSLVPLVPDQCSLTTELSAFLTTNHYPLITAFTPPPLCLRPHPPINSDPPPHQFRPTPPMCSVKL
jgi:hypothetical protein